MKHVTPPTDGSPLDCPQDVAELLSKVLGHEAAAQSETPLSDAERLAAGVLNLRRLRAEASAYIERLIELLDLTDENTDLEPEEDCCPTEEGEQDRADDEPFLGAPEIPPSFTEWSDKYQMFFTRQGDQAHWARGSTDDQEAEPEHDEETNDEEPSIGATSSIDQARWSAGGASDLEDEHDGGEPDDSGIADMDGYMEQCPALFQHSDQRAE